MNHNKIAALTIFILAAVTTAAFQNCAPNISSGADSSVGSGAASGTTSGSGTRTGSSSLVMGNAIGTIIYPYGDASLPNFNMGVNLSDAGYADGTYHSVSVGGITWNVFVGGSSSDSITGGAGNDALSGGAGDDVISAGASDDFVQGGPGNDIITGGNGNDWIYGGQGNDTIYGDRGNDVIFGNRGINTLYGANDTYSGTSEDGDDTFVLVLDDAGGADVANRPQDTIIDRGGNNRLLCRNSDMTPASGGTAYYEGADVIISFGDRGQARIKDFSTYPFATLDCGRLTVVAHP